MAIVTNQLFSAGYFACFIHCHTYRCASLNKLDLAQIIVNIENTKGTALVFSQFRKTDTFLVNFTFRV